MADHPARQDVVGRVAKSEVSCVIDHASLDAQREALRTKLATEASIDLPPVDPNPDALFDAEDNARPEDPYWGSFTDLGNGERFIRANGERVRYCTPKAKWLTYEHGCWCWDDGDAVNKLGHLIARELREIGEACPDHKEGAKFSAWGHKTEATSRITGMLASAAPYVHVMPQQLDPNPRLLNVASGVMDLSDCIERPHSPDYFMTRQSPAKYVPFAVCNVWEQFLYDCTAGDAELQHYLQRVVGYCLTGETSEKCFFFIFGPRDSGKSVFVDVISAMLGGYAVSTEFDTWVARPAVGGNRDDLVRLAGARLVTSVEIKKGARFDEGLLKKITGGDTIMCCAKFEHPIEYKPQFKLLIAANDAPYIRDDDDACWSRVRRIPFTHTVPAEHQDRELRAKLTTPEAQSAILHWAVQGCREWQTLGLGTCAAVEASVAEYRAEMDRCSGFLSEFLQFGQWCRISAKELRTAYLAWAEESGVKHPLSPREMASRLEEKGARQVRAHGGRREWDGVQMAPFERDDSPDYTLS
jgi:putative DNA primase/helicase